MTTPEDAAIITAHARGQHVDPELLEAVGITPRVTVEVARIYRFRGRHSLPDMPEPWCHEHEHDYTVEVVARGEGPVVVDTDRLDSAWATVSSPYSSLNRYVDVPTTVESLAAYWLERFRQRISEVHQVTVWEDQQRWGRATA